MGLKDDLERFRDIGEERREDLKDFIKHGEMGRSDEDAARIPIKIVDLPEFEYARKDQGGVGQGEGAQPGDPVGQPQPGDDEGDPGDEPGEHEYYEMDPEEFAQELEEELGLPELEPKGKNTFETREGDFNDTRKVGPESLRDMGHWYRSNLGRNLAFAQANNKKFLTEALKTDGYGPQKVLELAEEKGISPNLDWLEMRYKQLEAEERTTYESIKTVEDEFENLIVPRGAEGRIMGRGPYSFDDRPEDRKYRAAEIIREPQENVVVVNIRDVSGSMREEKRDLVERTFTPLDWYLTGKYDNAEFIYIAHDAEAWAVEREQFFGIRSGGGTKISSAYGLAKEILDQEYPWSDWNRYVFAAGDSENSKNDTEQQTIPLMEEIDANLHAYLETQPGDSNSRARHADEVADHFDLAQDEHDNYRGDNVAVAYVQRPDDVIPAIYSILSTESEEE